MEEMEQVDTASRAQGRRSVEARPILFEDGDSMTLQFRIGEIQSEMLVSDPDFLMLSYTRTMMAFRLFHKEPERLAMIGLGGGSMTKWCYRELPRTDITVIENNEEVISLRDDFHIPADDERFRVIFGDGADYVAGTFDSPEVLLVDGFDIYGQPPQLCSQEFYDDCYRALAPDGLLVVNLCGPGDQQAIDRVRRRFDDRVLIILPREDGENKVVFALKGERHWMEDVPTAEFAYRLRAEHPLKKMACAVRD
jgi:spermidine synthase